jgi:phage tail-like protein
MLPVFPLGNSQLLGGLGNGAPPPAAPAALGSDYLEDGISRIYTMLIRPIRDLDQQAGRALLERFLKRPEQSWQATLDRIRSLKKTDLPSTCPSDLLRYQKDLVGFTRELDRITSRLDEATLRKLIALAVPLWKRRGSEEGLVEWIRLLTGRTVFYRSWFDFRWVLGENEIGTDGQGNDGWLIGGETSVYDEFISNLHVMDTGTLDRRLLLDLVELSRPMSERIEVVISDLIDFFDGGKNLWRTITTPGGTVTAGSFALHPGTTEEAIVPIIVDPTSYGDYTSIHRVKFGARGNQHIVEWCVRPSGSMFQLVAAVQSTGTPELALSRFEGAAQTVIASGQVRAFQFVPGAFYTFRLETLQHGAPGGTRRNCQVKVYVDECLTIDADVLVNEPAQGTFRIGAPSSNTADDVVSSAEIFRIPLRFAKVAPAPAGGITTSPNFFNP